jgi:hypothetical protein
VSSGELGCIAGAHENSDAAVHERVEESEDSVAGEEVNSDHRLVENKESGLMGDRTRDGNPCGLVAVELAGAKRRATVYPRTPESAVGTHTCQRERRSSGQLASY